MRTRVKICGITRIHDAQRAVALGIDAIGLVFYAKSSRAVSLRNATQIARAIGPFVTTVGLFLDATRQDVQQVIDTVPLDLLQFHGDECPADCGVHGKPYIKAIPMGAETDVVLFARSYPDACGFLLDSHVPGGAGGLGTPFDWDKIPANLSRPLILAGGLDARNITEAISRIRPYAVDISSGVESEKGIKDAKKMAEFMKEVRRVDG